MLPGWDIHISVRRHALQGQATLTLIRMSGLEAAYGECRSSSLVPVNSDVAGRQLARRAAARRAVIKRSRHRGNPEHGREADIQAACLCIGGPKLERPLCRDPVRLPTAGLTMTSGYGCACSAACLVVAAVAGFGSPL